MEGREEVNWRKARRREKKRKERKAFFFVFLRVSFYSVCEMKWTDEK